jgi:hypothetical protein
VIRVPFLVFRNSYSPLMFSFRSLWSRIRVVVEVITIGGGLPGFLGASCSSSLRVYSLILRGAKKIRINTVFRGNLKTGDAGTGLFDYLALCEVFLEVCLLRLLASWKSSSWAVDYTDALFTAPPCPACALTFRTTFSSFSVTVYTPWRTLKVSSHQELCRSLLCSTPHYWK